MAAQRGDLDLLDVDAVDENLALLNIVIAADQAQNSGLARAGGANKGHRLLRLYMEGNALKHPLVGLIGKPDVFKLDLALDIVQLNGIRLIHHLRNHIQNAEYLFRGGKGALEHVKLLCQSLDGVKEPGDVHVKGHHNGAVDGLTKEHRILNIALCAKIEQAQLGGHEEHVHHGAKDAEHIHPVVLSLAELGALFHKVLQLPFLPVKDLGDLHAGQVLGKISVDVRGGVAHLPVYPAGELAEDHGEQHNKGHKAQHHQGQCIVEHQHGRQHAHDDHAVLGQGDDDVGEHVADGIGIVGNTGHQLAHRDVVQLLMAQAFNVGEHIQPDGRQDLLSGLLQDHGLQEGADQRYHQNAGVHRHHDPKVGQLKLMLEDVLNVADEQGRNHFVADGNHHHEENHHKALPIGLGVAQKPVDDFGVLHMPVGVLVGLFALLQGKVGQQEHQRECANNRTHDRDGKVVFHKLKHPVRLLPLPASASPPSCGTRRRSHRALRGCQPPPMCRHQ